jgi:hypothetical protein
MHDDLRDKSWLVVLAESFFFVVDHPGSMLCLCCTILKVCCLKPRVTCTTLIYGFLSILFCCAPSELCVQGNGCVFSRHNCI